MQRVAQPLAVSRPELFAPSDPPNRSLHESRQPYLERQVEPDDEVAFWWFLLLLGDLIFYVLLSPIWLGLRAAARIADLRERRRKEQARTK